VGSGSGGGSGGNGVTSRPLTATTKAKDSGSGHGFSALVSGSGSGLVSGEVWQDSNGNGILDTGETGMSGITVNLDDPTGKVLMTTTTDSNGNYLFGVNSSLGSQFEIQVVIPSGDSATIENAGSPPQIYSSIDSNGFSNVFALAAGGSVTLNAGLTGSGGDGNGTVSGEVWQDSDGNGILDTGESGMSSVTVNLNDSAGNVLMTTITNANGNYQFSVSPSLGSQFEIQVVIPSGDSATIENAGTDPQIYSSIDANGFSNVFALAAGAAVNLNAGLLPARADEYDWNPLNPNDLLASHPQNWIKNTVQQGADGTLPGTKPTDQVVLATASNIIWNQKFVFSTLTLGRVNAYTNQQTINSDVTVELTGAGGNGALLMDMTASALNLNFGSNARFQIDADSTITNMRLGGDQSGVLNLQDGWTSIAQGNFQDFIGVPILVSQGAALSDGGKCSLTFTNNDLSIGVYGLMYVWSSPGAGSTLINQANLINGCYVYVSGYTGGGILTYTGIKNTTDTFTVPVAVEAGGTFR
jgi:hypothetical protein